MSDIDEQKSQKQNNDYKNQDSQMQFSNNIIHVQPQLVHISSRRKRKYLKPENIKTENTKESQLKFENQSESIVFESNLKQQQSQKSSVNSQKSKTSSNKDTKPGKTIEQAYEEEQNQDFQQKDQNFYEYELQETRRRMIKIQQEKSNEQSNDDDEEEESEYSEQQQQKTQKIFKAAQNIRKIPLKQQPPAIFRKVNLDKSIHSPVPLGYKISCVIKYQAVLLGLSSKYLLYIRGQDKKQSIISAKKQLMALTPSYLISKSQLNHSIRNQNYIAQITANFAGTQWQLFSKNGERSNTNAILYSKYQSSLMGYRSFRTLSAVKTDPQRIQNSKSNKLMNLKEMFNGKKKGNLIKITTATPKNQKGKYKLDFRGLAKVPSSKNFILNYCIDEKSKKECLLLAKQNQNCYIMEVSYPLSILEGFALCLTSLNSKILVN